MVTGPFGQIPIPRDSKERRESISTKRRYELRRRNRIVTKYPIDQNVTSFILHKFSMRKSKCKSSHRLFKQHQLVQASPNGRIQGIKLNIRVIPCSPTSPQTHRIRSLHSHQYRASSSLPLVSHLPIWFLILH